MDWIEIFSWIGAAVLLAGIHVWPRKQRVPAEFGVFASAIIGALLGGIFVRILSWSPLAVPRYSFAALVGALVVAEVAILSALATRSGRQPPLAGGSV